jgi:hypothetical protein
MRNKILLSSFLLWQFIILLSIAGLNGRAIQLQKDVDVASAHGLYLKAVMDRNTAVANNRPDSEIQDLTSKEAVAHDNLLKVMIGK